MLSPGIDLGFALDGRQYQKAINNFCLGAEQLLMAGVDAHAVNQISNFSFLSFASLYGCDDYR